ncbi:hypothetical protein GCM10009665_19410 [Kitasatospora nipponensis]|uniref:PH (Pleckstrin Homology) domain-containing protein n=1 Tax=Kitasatospora nipponensis TaxID=258049 RepID=A0ABP4GRK2_9ACTN
MHLRRQPQHRSEPAPEQARTGRPAVLVDRRWAPTARAAALGAGTLSALTLLTDWATGGLTLPRALLWTLLGWTAFALLLPPRISAGEGWLEVRGPLRGRRLRTDALVSVRRAGAVATQLLLLDAHGVLVELDPRVLVANPLLWQRLATDARRSTDLRSGTRLLRELDEQVFAEPARRLLAAPELADTGSADPAPGDPGPADPAHGEPPAGP